MAKHAHGDAVAREADAHLDEALAAARNHLEPAGSEPKDQHECEDRNKTNEDDPVDFEPSALEEDHGREELVDVRALEAALTGRSHYHQVHGVF